MEQRVLKSGDLGRILCHTGVLEKSGRYPWGSGDRPYQRLEDWRKYVKQSRKDGLSDADIAKMNGMTLEEFKDSLLSSSERRAQTSGRNAKATVANVAQAWRYKDRGWSNTAIAAEMGVTEGTIRNWLKPGADAKAQKLINVSDAIREAVDSKGYVDIGKDVERYLGINPSNMKAAVAILKDEGYQVWYKKAAQLGTGKETTFMVLAKPDADYKTFSEEFKNDPSIVKPIGYYGEDKGAVIKKIQDPVKVARDRIFVRYAEDGGLEKDGCIELRPGVEDIDLMDTRYAQVRIAVEGDLFMKGMAVYSKNIPDGYDIVYNVNKHAGTPDSEVFKKFKRDKDNVFGANTMQKMVDPETGDIIYQKDYVGKDGKMHQSALNIVNDAGSWEDWSKTLASQFLSKQPPELAKQQLDIAAQSRQDEFDTIMSLTNPTIKKKLLDEFADSCDSDAVHLKAAALPRQKTQVIIPIPSLKDNEVYAPNFNPGETVVLIRYPHAGRFEIPELKVNNKNKEAIDVIGKTGQIDAVGINSKVAQQLSGADFDGDNVIVIPNNDGAIKVEKMNKDLQNFNMDPYTLPADSPERQKSEASRTRMKNRQMGEVSNLITDMTIKGADTDEIIRAVKHSMVVIDSVKHFYDWKQSEKDFGIQELKDKYQAKDEPGKKGGGASTLISKAKSEERVPKRKEAYSTRGMTEEEIAAWNRGEKVYKKADDAEYKEYKLITDPRKMTASERERYEQDLPVYRDTGKVKQRMQKSTKMAEAKDARELSSGYLIEEIYADYANQMKFLANQARAASRTCPRLEKSPSAEKVYASEVESLKEKLDLSKKNAPIERQAVLLSNAMMAAKLRSNPDMKDDKDSYKKEKFKCLQEARDRVGANKSAVAVKITDKEWEAIQAGAISDSMLREILTNTDTEAIKQRAMPRSGPTVSSAQITRAKAMAANGLTQAEIAEALGIGTSTVASIMTGKIK